MSTTRIFSPVRLSANTKVPLGSDQARYVGKVLRLRPGDALTLFDGTGGEFGATIDSIGKTTGVVNVGEHRNVEVESAFAIHLLQGVSRGERMDFVVQKATELGVARITPLISEFAVVKLDRSRAIKRQLHWSKIAISACEQCGRNTLPQIDPAISLRDCFGDNIDTIGPGYVLIPGATANLSVLADPGARLTLLVGPEGGLSAVEYEQASAAGLTAAGLGPRILRTETAAIAAIAALQTLYGDL
jgi:16S rRNA (uracil1498-N3)-methyltransferase